MTKSYFAAVWPPLDAVSSIFVMTKSLVGTPMLFSPHMMESLMLWLSDVAWPPLDAEFLSLL